MKICLYLEFYYFLGGVLFKKIGTGLLSSYKNQKTMLNHLGIRFTEKWDDSCDILQINTPWLKSVYLIKKAKKRRKKVIIWSHVTVEDTLEVFRFMRLLAPLTKKYLTYAYGLADLVFCPSEYTKSLLANYGLPKEKLIVQSNAVDLEKIFTDLNKRILGREKYSLNTLTIGTVGQVIPRKGIDTFLFMANKFPNNQFIWLGNFFNQLLVKSLPNNLPKNVQFTGYVDDINEAYNLLDIFIFPSYEENQGVAILEAAAVGLPIVVRDIPVYNGWLIHGENCLKAKTDKEFGEYISLLLKDNDLRVKLGGNAKILAQKESAESLSEKLLSEYKKLLCSKVRPMDKKDIPQVVKEVGFDFSWDEEKVWKLDIPVTEMDIQELVWHFDIPFHWHKGGIYNLKSSEIIENPEQYREEYERVMKVDLKYPIDIMKNKDRWLILDGLHRLIKAYILKMNKVKVRIIPREKIPAILKET